MFKRVALVLVALALLAFVGCAKAPEAEMQKANSAIEAARTAEAETYAPESFRVANDTINAAMAAKQEADGKFSLFRSYTKAKEMFVRADELANKAAADAATEKENVRIQVGQKLLDVKAVLDSAQVALNKAPRGKGTKADIALFKSDLDAAGAAYAEADADYAGGKYMIARTKLDGVLERARAVMQQIEVAKAKKMAK